MDWLTAWVGEGLLLWKSLLCRVLLLPASLRGHLCLGLLIWACLSGESVVGQDHYLPPSACGWPRCLHQHP